MNEEDMKKIEEEVEEEYLKNNSSDEKEKCKALALMMTSMKQKEVAMFAKMYKENSKAANIMQAGLLYSLLVTVSEDVNEAMNNFNEISEKVKDCLGMLDKRLNK